MVLFMGDNLQHNESDKMELIQLCLLRVLDRHTFRSTIYNIQYAYIFTLKPNTIYVYPHQVIYSIYIP